MSDSTIFVLYGALLKSSDHSSSCFMDRLTLEESSSSEIHNEDSDAKITCFTNILDDVTLNFQIVHLNKQIYVWIGYNSAKLGHVYAAAPTRPDNTVSVTSILGGSSDNTGASIARRLVLRTGLNIIVACNIPKNNPMIEAGAEKKLIEKFIGLGYTKPK